jgi:hypothetical protein
LNLRIQKQNHIIPRFDIFDVLEKDFLMNWKRTWVILLSMVGLLSFSPGIATAEPIAQSVALRKKISASDKRLMEAWESGLSEFKIRCRGEVVMILSDDNDGSRHQRFIIQLATGQTLLVAHNIDLAPRVARLKMGDRLTVRGEYIWNEEGGIMHFTHRNSLGFGFHGWIRKKGNVYW